MADSRFMQMRLTSGLHAMQGFEYYFYIFFSFVLIYLIAVLPFHFFLILQMYDLLIMVNTYILLNLYF